MTPSDPETDAESTPDSNAAETVAESSAHTVSAPGSEVAGAAGEGARAAAQFDEDGAARPPGEAGVTGIEVIRAQLRHLPDQPGVYRMLDARGEVLYVGKARSLKTRVASYARPTGHTARIARMISATASMMFLTTNTETEALLLEQNLIKQLKPRFNVLLRDDKSFPNIVVGDAHAFPKIAKHRGARREAGRYFGPFAGAGAVNRTLNQLQRAFLLRTCTDSVFDNRTRPCLLFQIKRCSAPCVGRISEEDYAGAVDDAVRFLEGKSSDIQKGLAEEMAAASRALEFERAAALRDRIKALTQVQAVQGINPESTDEADVVALHQEGGQACVQVFFFRAHQNWGNRAYYPRTGAGAEPAEILEAFLVQFYSTKEPPKRVLLSDPVEDVELLAEALAARRGRKVDVAVPARGEKRLLVEHALRNAKESLARKMAESSAQATLLEGLAEAFGLDSPPQRIEVYDNSHIQGAHAVGAMIVAGPEGFVKSQYRKFNIKQAGTDDDFGMMREVLERRFARLLKEDPDRELGHWPDLLLIDGGAGQISATAGILAELGVEDVALFGVAKGEDRDAGKEVFHVPGRAPFALPHRSPTLYFIQRLRDEAHRFAIGTHRAKRAKASVKNPLDDVPGVGPTRKRALLAHFGSAKGVTRAGVEELKAVSGVSEALAETIHAHFHPGA
ncbi:Excinuclease ABC subunit C [Albimonas donghaensis]|uniref:UvrABC system protein C n=1 Tax=Albimonas donghaensis TaxID=356660 RepID=A0A1H2WY36_9RHOB|nr:excinuclease ABC subunit UvrC [Albimonas donghaensis]SDW85481.1 Excinuclease ABC subunit C [Albimonas donghaensis]